MYHTQYINLFSSKTKKSRKPQTYKNKNNNTNSAKNLIVYVNWTR